MAGNDSVQENQKVSPLAERVVQCADCEKAAQVKCSGCNVATAVKNVNWKIGMPAIMPFVVHL
jgi:hypothetical protein